MSAYESLSIVLMVLAIVVTLLIALIENKKQPPQVKGSGYFL